MSNKERVRAVLADARSRGRPALVTLQSGEQVRVLPNLTVKQTNEGLEAVRPVPDSEETEIVSVQFNDVVAAEIDFG